MTYLKLSRPQMDKNWDRADGEWRRDHAKSRVSGIAEKIRSAREPMPVRPIADIRIEQESHRNTLRRAWAANGGIARS